MSKQQYSFIMSYYHLYAYHHASLHIALINQSHLPYSVKIALFAVLIDHALHPVKDFTLFAFA